MIRNAALFLVMLLPSICFGQINLNFNFNGQNAEILHAEKKITTVVSEEVEVPSTCYNRIPYEENVCRDVTRYRQSCDWIPSSERCWNETERVCRPVSRTRQECSQGPSRRVCTERPGRQVCTERPTREVCRTDRNGRQHCSTVGGGTHCTTVGGGQSCHDVPGERQCRTVSYTEQDCDNVSRRRCETIPGRNHCTDIPYSEEVCEMETRYHHEPYACTKTEIVHRNIEKTLKTETNIEIITNGIADEFALGISIKELTKDFKKFSIETALLNEPKVFVVLKKKEVTVISETNEEIQLKARVILEVLSQEMLPISFPSQIISATANAETSRLAVVFEGPISSQGAVDLLITHKAFFSSRKTIAEFKDRYPGEKIELGMSEEKAALFINLKDHLKREFQRKNMLLKLTLTAELNLQGEMLNTTKPELTKVYEGTFVRLE